MSQEKSAPTRRPSGEHVGHGPGLVPARQQLELGRARRHPGPIMVQAVDIGLHPGPGLLGQAPLHLGHGMGEVDDAQRLVDLAGQRAQELGHPPLPKQLQEFHLRLAQMRVHHAQREGEVAVGLGLDVGHHVPVPAHLDRLLERQALGREHGQALLPAQRTAQAQEPAQERLRQLRQEPAAGQRMEHGRTIRQEAPGRSAGSGNGTRCQPADSRGKPRLSMCRACCGAVRDTNSKVVASPHGMLHFVSLPCAGSAA